MLSCYGSVVQLEKIDTANLSRCAWVACVGVRL